MSEKTGYHGNLRVQVMLYTTNKDRELLYFMDHITYVSLYYHSE